jgi:hypothetical protein
MYFGNLPIEENKHIVLQKTMTFLNDFLERPHLYDDAPAWLRTLSPNGSLTEAQWQIVDELAKIKQERPTLMDLVNTLGKKSTSSITKPRDIARKKILEAILTLTYVISDDDIMNNFIGEFIDEINNKKR